MRTKGPGLELEGFYARLASAEHRHGNGDHDDDGNQDHDDGNRIADRIEVRASHRALLSIAHTVNHGAHGRRLSDGTRQLLSPGEETRRAFKVGWVAASSAWVLGVAATLTPWGRSELREVRREKGRGSGNGTGRGGGRGGIGRVRNRRWTRTVRGSRGCGAGRTTGLGPVQARWDVAADSVSDRGRSEARFKGGAAPAGPPFRWPWLPMRRDRLIVSES